MILKDKNEPITVDDKDRIISLKEWCNKHKKELLITGLSIGSIIIGVILRNNSDDYKFEKWFKNASLKELETAREAVRSDYINPNLDTNYRASLYHVLHRFDSAIHERKSAGIEPGFPVHREHGWYLPGD